MSTHKLNPVAWSEGMFLRPQHLQQHDLFGDARLHYHLHALDPFHWGVRELALDEEALAEKRIVVTRLDAVLRDGTVLRVPGNATLESRSFEAGRDRLDLHLGLRSWSATEPNVVDGDGRARNARYRLAEAELPDLNRGGPASGVEVLAPNLRLLLTGEENELGLYETLKLAEIEASDDSKRPWVLSRTYVPPLLAMQASGVLRDDVISVKNLVRGRVRTAAGLTKGATVAAMRQLFMRYTLARSAPLLEHLLSTGETPPFPLYTALVEIAGALAAYEREEAIELPVYDHENLYRCFRGLLDFISDVLDRLAPVNFEKRPLPYDAAVQAYATRGLGLQLVDPRNSYFLAVRAPIEAKELAAIVAEKAKASSIKGVGGMIVHNLPGLPIEPLPAAPTEIEAMSGYHYFRVDPASKEWARVRSDLSFALHLGPLQNAQVFLYVAFAPEAG